MFGKRNRPAEAELPPPAADSGFDEPSTAAAADGGGRRAASSDHDSFPWERDPACVACNLAAGNLANNLVAWVANDGPVHAETYVAAAGAIAGYAAQRSLMAQHGATLSPELQVLTTTAGERYLLGDPLNAMLFAQSEADANGRVWPRAAGTAMRAGLPLAQVPNTDDMFRFIADNLGGPQEGFLSTGKQHQPAVPVRELLALYWPPTERLLKADFDELHRRFGPVPVKWWGAVAAYATSRPILDVKDVLKPAIALTILMESAIYASKLTRF
jgi:hypothetical protein